MNHRFWLGVVYVAIIGALSNIAAVFIDRSQDKRGEIPVQTVPVGKERQDI